MPTDVEESIRRLDEGRAAPLDLYVRGHIPRDAGGSVAVATSRRLKDRRIYSRWHDSATDLIRLDLIPGRPGRVQARVLSLSGNESPRALSHRMSDPAWHGATEEPNHGINHCDATLWATNLLFGAPVEVDMASWEPRRVVRVVEPKNCDVPVSSTSHFAWSVDRSYAFFHQALLVPGGPGDAARAAELRLIQLDTRTGRTKSWEVIPPPDDARLTEANFHSAFGFTSRGKQHVGLLRTGATVEHLCAHESAEDHAVVPMTASTIWIVAIEPGETRLQAVTLPGIRELDGIALSHLAVDSRRDEGFVLFANYKEADVGEETHGANLYGETPDEVAEHYSGMTVEPLNFGQIFRYEWNGRMVSLRRFARPFDPGRASQGHSWLPINLELDPSHERLFASFSGFRPRLLSRHIADAYPTRVTDMRSIGHVPPLLMRFDATTLVPDDRGDGGHLSYAEPMAFTVIEGTGTDYVCTFSPELGFRLFLADDLSEMICHAFAPELLTWRDTHFRPEPAHLKFLRL